MARIRSVKPEFFRHELLQDLEAAHPEAHPMLVFAGLWCHCDKNGTFPWKPRTLKLDILPFLDFDLGASLVLLGENGLLKVFESGGERYGVIPTFREHQRISGKEAQDAAKYPEHHNIFSDVSQGSAREATGKQPVAQEGKGKEEDTLVLTNVRTNDADGVDEPEDLKTRIFGPAREWLAKASGKSDAQVRKVLGQWCRDHGDGKTLTAIEEASRNAPLDPIPYITKILNRPGRDDTPPPDPDAEARRAAREAEKRRKEDEEIARVTRMHEEIEKRELERAIRECGQSADENDELQDIPPHLLRA